MPLRVQVAMARVEAARRMLVDAARDMAGFSFAEVMQQQGVTAALHGFVVRKRAIRQALHTLSIAERALERIEAGEVSA